MRKNYKPRQYRNPKKTFFCRTRAKRYARRKKPTLLGRYFKFFVRGWK